MGIDGVDSNEAPLPNILVDFIKDKGMLKHGVLFLLGNAIVATGLSPQEIAEKTSTNELDITSLPLCEKEKAYKALQPYIDSSINRIAGNRKKRRFYKKTIAKEKNHIYTLLLQQETYTKTLFKHKLLLVKAQILLQLSEQQVKVF